MYKIRNWGNTLKKELKGMKSTKTKKIRREDIPNLETSERVKIRDCGGAWTSR